MIDNPFVIERKVDKLAVFDDDGRVLENVRSQEGVQGAI